LERLAKTARLNWPNLTLSHLTAYKRRMKTEELRQYSRLSSKGKLVLSIADDKYSKSWPYKPHLLKPSRFLTALRLRSRMTGDRDTTPGKSTARSQLSKMWLSIGELGPRPRTMYPYENQKNWPPQCQKRLCCNTNSSTKRSTSHRGNIHSNLYRDP
jgi:hypothetical protein